MHPRLGRVTRARCERFQVFGNTPTSSDPQGVPQRPTGLRPDAVDANGLQDVPHPQHLPRRQRLCRRLQKVGETEVCEEVREGRRILQMLHQEGRCILPRVQV